ncbi:hypothetical protein DFJ74DRAFT_697097 [Hyaloraphidium curvatum]|nr:hypothetical protein DFJ74DRAFT_697097 [Hyaloraphidium curvatum]
MSRAITLAVALALLLAPGAPAAPFPNSKGVGRPRYVPYTLGGRRLEDVSAGCAAAANATGPVAERCVATEMGKIFLAGFDSTTCSTGCASAVTSYWDGLTAACGSETLVSIVARNASLSRNLSAADLAPSNLLGRALFCAKDASGASCIPGVEYIRSAPKGAGFNETRCKECAAAALAAVDTVAGAYPSATYFTGNFFRAASWADVRAELSGRCARTAAAASSRSAAWASKTVSKGAKGTKGVKAVDPVKTKAGGTKTAGTKFLAKATRSAKSARAKGTNKAFATLVAKKAL